MIKNSSKSRSRSSLSERSIHHGRCAKHSSRRSALDLNSSALLESTATPSYAEKIPPAPPFPPSFEEHPSSETLKSTEFSQAIQTPSTSRNRRRTPLTPDILALTKLRRPEHIKSSIAQRIEELKQASLTNHRSDSEKASTSNEKSSNLLVTCDYQNTPHERQWFKEQIQNSTPLKFFNTPQYLQLSDRVFTIRSLEYLDQHQVRFHLVEQSSFIPQCFKQMNILTILIISILRLVENTLSNLSIPGVPTFLNLIYVLILISIAILLLINQK